MIGLPLLSQEVDPDPAILVGGGGGTTDPSGGGSGSGSGGGSPPPATPGKRAYEPLFLNVLDEDTHFRLAVTRDHAASDGSYLRELSIVRTDHDGQVDWTRHFLVSDLDLERGIRVAVDDFGGLLMAVQFTGTLSTRTGHLFQSKGLHDIALFKLGVDGKISWRRQIGGSGDFSMADLEIDGVGAVLLYGSVLNTYSFDAAMSEMEEHRSFVITLDQRGGLGQIIFDN